MKDAVWKDCCTTLSVFHPAITRAVLSEKVAGGRIACSQSMASVGAAGGDLVRRRDCRNFPHREARDCSQNGRTRP